MENEEYLEVQNTLLQFGKAARMFPVDQFIAHLNQALIVGPVLDPTLYRRGVANLKGILRLAEAVREIQAADENLQQAVLRTLVAESGDGAL